LYLPPRFACSDKGLLSALPLQSNADLFSPLFSGQNGQGRAPPGQNALTRLKIEAIIVIGAANLPAFERTGLEIRFFVRTLSREREIFSLDERQKNLASAEIDLFHRPRRQLTHPSYRDVTYSHRVRRPLFVPDRADREELARATRRSTGHLRVSLCR
jgi:hypothetical protein